MSKIKLHLGICFYKALRVFVRALNPLSALRLSSFLSSVLGKSLTRELAISRAQLQFVQKQLQGRSPLNENLDLIPAGVFKHLGQSLVEIMIADRLFELNPGRNPNTPWAPNFKHFSFEADESLQNILDEQKPMLALTGHLGCFELLAPFYARLGFEVSVFRRSSNYPVLNEIHRTFLEWSDAEVLWRDDKESPRKLLRRLRSRNSVIAALIDQDIDLDNEYSKFFNLEAASPVAPIKLAIKYKLPIYATFIVRTAPLQHRITISEILYDPASTAPAKSIITEYNRRLEELITKYPQQWIWWHRRWRRRPETDYNQHPDKLRGTKDYITWLGNLKSSPRN